MALTTEGCHLRKSNNVLLRRKTQTLYPLLTLLMCPSMLCHIFTSRVAILELEGCDLKTCGLMVRRVPLPRLDKEILLYNNNWLKI
jgi:hypothetical protein